MEAPRNVAPPCIFCSTTPNSVVKDQLLFETQHWSVLMDNKPIQKGHLICVPKENRVERREITQLETSDWYTVQQKIHEIYEKNLKTNKNIQYEQNDRRGIPHFKVFVVPLHSFGNLVFLQIKLFLRSFLMPFWKLDKDALATLRKELLQNVELPITN